MLKRKYPLSKKDQVVLDRFILRTGGTPAWRTVQASLIEQCLGIIGKPLPEITTDDLLKVRDTVTASDYRPNYQRRLILSLRRFFLWYGKGAGLDLEEIKSIKLPKGQWKTKKPEDMLTPADVETVLKAVKNARDRAFLAMLWDGSNRPVELLTLNWEDIGADQYGYFFKTSAKTGKERHIRLTISIPYLEAWKRDYPGEPAGQNPVFVTVHKVNGKNIRWTRDAASALMKELRRATGMKKLKLSIFRPSRITHDVKAGYDMPYIMKKNWGSLKTNMIDLYTNIDSDYVDQVALRQAGMARVEEMKDKEQYKLEVPECPGCHTLNVMGSQFCSRCLTPLTPGAVSQEERLKKEIASMIEAAMKGTKKD